MLPPNDSEKEFRYPCSTSTFLEFLYKHLVNEHFRKSDDKHDVHQVISLEQTLLHDFLEEHDVSSSYVFSYNPPFDFGLRFVMITTMIIINKRTKSRTKLHFYNCLNCNKQFGSYRNKTKTCSEYCRRKLVGSLKSRSVKRICCSCGNTFLHKPSQDRRGFIHQFCSRKCRFPLKKLNLPLGQYLSFDGYIVVSRTHDGRKQIKLHRLIMEEHIGKKLLPKEIVHHINQNKIDNRIENLQIVSRSEHNTIHKFLNR